MGRVVHFEIHADDPARAVTFYSNLFGWQFNKWDGPAEYWMVITGVDGIPGINGGLLRRHGPPPTSGQPVCSYVCTAHVDSVDASLEKVAFLGGSVALPKMPIPGVGWLAYAKDSEGNIFGMMQPDPAAK